MLIEIQTYRHTDIQTYRHTGGSTEAEIEVIDNNFTETDDPDEKPTKVKGNAKVKI